MKLHKLQSKISVAYKDENPKLVEKKYQKILVNSFSARILAINQVVKTRESQTPGVDGYFIKNLEDI
jgi:hypothetical protein